MTIEDSVLQKIRKDLDELYSATPSDMELLLAHIDHLTAKLAETEAKLQREREDAGKLCYRYDQLEQRLAALKAADGRMGGRGVLAIAKERKRQRDSEGWTEQHDDSHAHGEMALVAALYATPKNLYEKLEKANGTHFVDPWPWDRGWDKRKRHSEVKRLAIAGALIAAEIDRLHRITKPQPSNAE